MSKEYNRRQLLALIFVFSLSPIMRIVPKHCTELAGPASWFSPFLALPFILLYILYMSAFLKHRHEGEGLGDMIVRSIGRKAGAVVLFISALMFTFYCGFVLRSGADRFISTIYPASTPWVFVFVMLAIGLIAALGPFKAVVRAAKIFAPFLTVILLIVTALALTSVEKTNFLPIDGYGLPSMLRSALPVFDVFAGVFTFTAFIEGPCPERADRNRDFILWFLPVCLLTSAVTAAIVGNYGHVLTTELSHPFFSMVRDLTLFNTIERIEAFVVTLWVLPDFVIFTTMLVIASRCFRRSFGFLPEKTAVPSIRMDNGRWTIPVCAVLAAISAFIIPTDSNTMERYSEIYIPTANLILSAGLFPLCFIIGKIRKKQ